MAKQPHTTRTSAFDKGKLFRAAHQAARDEIAAFPVTSRTISYRQLFAMKLRRAYADVQAPRSAELVDLQNRRQLIEMKTRLSDQDWAELRELNRQMVNAGKVAVRNLSREIASYQGAA